MASDKPEEKPTPTNEAKDQKPTAQGEDDEFEDFPVDGTSLPRLPYWRIASHDARAFPTNFDTDWPDDQTEAAQTRGDTKHLWEESWDDDDTTDDFSTQLKYVTPNQTHVYPNLHQFENSMLTEHQQRGAQEGRCCQEEIETTESSRNKQNIQIMTKLLSISKTLFASSSRLYMFHKWYQ